MTIPSQTSSLPRGALIFLTAVGQRHRRQRMTHFLKDCIQGCINHVRRPQLKAPVHPQHGVNVKGGAPDDSVLHTGRSKMYGGTSGCQGATSKKWTVTKILQGTSLSGEQRRRKFPSYLYIFHCVCGDTVRCTITRTAPEMAVQKKQLVCSENSVIPS